MDRPKVNVEMEASDWFIEIAGAVFIILMIGFPIYYFEQLPEIIPRHFNALGEPDGYSGKNVIWTLPVIGLTMYVGLFFLNKFPYMFNYPQEITEDNAEHQYRFASKLIRTLNMVIAGSFFYLSYNTIMIGLGTRVTLGAYFLPVFLILIFGVIGVYLYRALKKKI